MEKKGNVKQLQEIRMVDRHYSLNLKPLSARTLYFYAHADLVQKYSAGNFCLHVVLPGRKLYFPALGKLDKGPGYQATLYK